MKIIRITKDIYTYLYCLYLSIFRKFIPKNKICAKLGQTVCIVYNSYRRSYRRKLATVIDVGWVEYNEEKPTHRMRYPTFVTLKFKDSVAYNFKPEEYYILPDK